MKASTPVLVIAMSLACIVGYAIGHSEKNDAEQSLLEEINLRREQLAAARVDGSLTPQQIRNSREPEPPVPGSENDPDYQAEVRDNGDGTISLLPAPAFRAGYKKPGGKQ